MKKKERKSWVGRKRDRRSDRSQQGQISCGFLLEPECHSFLCGSLSCGHEFLLAFRLLFLLPPLSLSLPPPSTTSGFLNFHFDCARLSDEKLFSFFLPSNSFCSVEFEMCQNIVGWVIFFKAFVDSEIHQISPLFLLLSFPSITNDKPQAQKGFSHPFSKRRWIYNRNSGAKNILVNLLCNIFTLAWTTSINSYKLFFLSFRDSDAKGVKTKRNNT